MPKLNRKNLIAFDVATTTGWCVGVHYGHFNLKVKSDESSGMKLIRFESKLKEFYANGLMDIVVFERVAGRHAQAIICEAELIGILKRFCEEKKIEYRSYSAPEIKKFATGKGNASKEAVIKSVTEKYHYPGDNDNEADAIALWHLAKEDLKL